MAAPAWAVDLWTTVKPYADRLAVWRGYEQELQTLAIYGIGIAIYTALVFAFYQNLSKRKPFHFKFSEGTTWTARASRAMERALLFPLTSFVYFAVLALALFVLTKATTSVETLLLIAMSVVVAVRVTVYLSEAMSNDLSKLVPLSLLGVLLVDPGYLKLSTAWTRIGEAIDLWPLLGRYFLLFIALEAVMATARWTILRVGSRMRSSRTVPVAQGSRPPPVESTFSVVVQEPEKPADAQPKGP